MGWITYGKDYGNATPHCFCSRQIGLLTQPQVLRLATIALPARNCSSKEEDLNALTRREGRDHLLAAFLPNNVYYSSTRGLRWRLERGRAVCTVNHGDRVYVEVAVGSSDGI